MKAWSVTMLATCWLLLQLGADPASLCFFSLSHFFFFLGTFLLLLWFFFFSLQIPLFKIWNYQISFRSLFFFVFFHFFFIFSRFDHNFISVYWPKFTGKAETKRNCPNLKNQSWFSKLYGLTTVPTGLFFFPIERFLKLKKHPWTYGLGWKFKMCIKQPWTFRPPIYKLPIQAYYQTINVRNMNIRI